MALIVEELAQELKGMVRPSGSRPSHDDYLSVVRAAVRDYGVRRPMVKEDTIDVVSGTATYNMPSDFWQLIWIESPGTRKQFVSESGIIPLPASGWDERHSVNGQTITFYPTPEYAWASRRYRYKAFYEEVSGAYAMLSQMDQAIFMHKAQELALMLLANSKAPDAVEYRQTGHRGVQEDRAGAVAALRAQAESARKAYEAALEQANIGAALRQRYTQAEIDTYNTTVW